MPFQCEIKAQHCMSYFIIANGNKPDLSGLDPIKPIPIEEGQVYVSKCVNDFREMGISGDFWFIDDGYSGTSDDIITESYHDAHDAGTWEGTSFYRTLMACEEIGASIFLWCGNHDTHLNLKEVKTFYELVHATIGDEGLFFGEVGVYYRNPKNGLSGS
jgi:hypothetical protein